MRAVIQRVSEASVTIDEEVKSQIGAGLLILLGIEETDTKDDIDWLAGKIARLRVFNDSNGVMNLSVQDVDGEAIVVSQFTLHANIKKETGHLTSKPPGLKQQFHYMINL